MSKHIFITGGVVSSLGKGLASASIGMLLENHGLCVRLQKLDPYINVDPGTMNPYQHGEVYVTLDGAETDLDLGHYERFTNAPISRDSNLTTGTIYSRVIAKERAGQYLGDTVQVIPHITDEIKNGIKRLATPEVDVVISEIGGTVGDIESLPFLEALRQMPLDIGKENCIFIHLTLIPYIRAADELKTKPTQHSVERLRGIGIQPDILICRTEHALNDDLKSKISLFCNVPPESVIEGRDVETSIYELPLDFRKQGLDDSIIRTLGLQVDKPKQFDKWNKIVHTIKNPQKDVTIAVVGKYIHHQDAYKSIYEALAHAGIANNARVNIQKVESGDLENGDVKLEDTFKNVSGILVPGGFGSRGIEGKINSVHFARMQQIPFLGICLGMQCATIEFARHACDLKDANSMEFDPDTAHAVIHLMTDQKNISDKGGTMRLGGYLCKLTPGSLAAKAYKVEKMQERHRHRYELNNEFRETFRKNGLHCTGLSPDANLVEIIEIPDHPWFVASQFHPEFQSKPTRAHPLFREFVQAALHHAG